MSEETIQDFLKMDTALLEVLTFFSAIFGCSFLSIHVYFKIRNLFPITVNCWFCNNWIRVPFNERNSFICTKCEQYNGFTSDGDYNVSIPAQYNEDCNETSFTCHKNRSYDNSPKNRLCMECNLKQHIKVTALADFEPSKEKYFDKELNDFRDKLEESFKLCDSCERVLEETLKKEKVWLFGNNILRYKKSGLSLLKSKSKSGTPIFITATRFLLKVTAFLIILTDVITKRHFISYYLHKLAPDLFQKSSSYSNEIVVYETNKFKEIIPLALVGFLTELILMMCDNLMRKVKMWQFFCWTSLLVTSVVGMDDLWMFFTLFIQISCSLIILMTISNKFKPKPVLRMTKIPTKPIKTPEIYPENNYNQENKVLHQCQTSSRIPNSEFNQTSPSNSSKSVRNFGSYLIQSPKITLSPKKAHSEILEPSKFGFKPLNKRLSSGLSDIFERCSSPIDARSDFGGFNTSFEPFNRSPSSVSCYDMSQKQDDVFNNTFSAYSYHNPIESRPYLNFNKVSPVKSIFGGYFNEPHPLQVPLDVRLSSNNSAHAGFARNDLYDGASNVSRSSSNSSGIGSFDSRQTAFGRVLSNVTKPSCNRSLFSMPCGSRNAPLNDFNSGGSLRGFAGHSDNLNLSQRRQLLMRRPSASEHLSRSMDCLSIGCPSVGSDCPSPDPWIGTELGNAWTYSGNNHDYPVTSQTNMRCQKF